MVVAVLDVGVDPHLTGADIEQPDLTDSLETVLRKMVGIWTRVASYSACASWPTSSRTQRTHLGRSHRTPTYRQQLSASQLCALRADSLRCRLRR
jgi:hypothetical protein